MAIFRLLIAIFTVLFRALVNKFNKIIEVKRVLEVPSSHRPVEIDRKVHVPSSVLNYLDKRKRRREDDDNIVDLTKTSKKGKSLQTSDETIRKKAKRIKLEPV